MFSYSGEYLSILPHLIPFAANSCLSIICTSTGFEWQLSTNQLPALSCFSDYENDPNDL